MNLPHVVLAGNPNCGKTALFNALTGSHQRVGNWPGVTVEQKRGRCDIGQQSMEVVDLPGVYSLLSYGDQCSLDAQLACQHLLTASVDVIVNVIDAANLERHLFLTTQLLDLSLPMVVAVNMLDVLERRGGHIDLAALQQRLGCPVVGIVASKQQNIAALQQAIATQVQKRRIATPVLRLPPAVSTLQQQIADQMVSTSEHRAFSALRVIEGDACVHSALPPSLQAALPSLLQQVQDELGEEVDLWIADQRYQFCAAVRKSVIAARATAKPTVTDRVDRLMLHKFLGYPIFLLIMYAMFFFAINVGGAFQDFFDIGSDTVFVQGLAHLLAAWHCPSWLIALLADGLGKGINTTITFTPMIAGLFFFLSLLEDSGYMARATFLMDRLMRALGLPGESFVPMIVGFGCNVPAVMGARTLSNLRDRILTVVMMPFMSCGARFAIFSIFAAAFFPRHGAALIFLLYLLGIAAAVVTGVVFRKTCLPGESAALVMELPCYHRPQWQSLWRSTRRRTAAFVVRAGKVIVPVCILLGALNAITINGSLSQQDANTKSLLSVVGRAVTPVFEPMGIHADNWPATVGLTTGILAKEVVIGTLNSLYAEQAQVKLEQDQFDFWGGLHDAVASVPENIGQLAGALSNPVVASAADVSMDKASFGVMEKQFVSRGAAFAYLVFVLLYFPCISTLAAMRREVGRRWASLSMLWSCGFAYVLAVICFQLTQLTQAGFAAIAWIAFMVLLLVAMMLGLRRVAPPVTAMEAV